MATGIQYPNEHDTVSILMDPFTLIKSTDIGTASQESDNGEPVWLHLMQLHLRQPALEQAVTAVNNVTLSGVTPLLSISSANITAAVKRPHLM
ncbi:hypothetical protein U9M48_027094 [Paspalum notatum var. saurae]|uniref:Uncharacterized protein n=1 Tax=Paspalum notatum var. saurae TaxID=547442 RepID=A0AAQ3TVU5_PASNO